MAVMGRTGSGKTTLLSTINGLIPHFTEGELKGQILVKGVSTREMTIQKLVSQVGFVMQDPDTQILGMTVEKDVAFGPCNLAFTRERIENNVNKAIQTVGLDQYRQTSPEKLSGGEKQRLAIAGILALDSPILVFDEPTSELDPQGAESISETLLQLKQTGIHTILFSTHESQFVIDKADELWVIDEGRIVYQGRPQDFFADPDLTGKYGLQSPEICELFSRLRKSGVYSNAVVPTTISSSISEVGSLLAAGTNRLKMSTGYPVYPQITEQQSIIEIDRNTHRDAIYPMLEC